MNVQDRIKTRLKEIAADPNNFRLCKPLRNSECRSAHVAGWRIIIRIHDGFLQVADIDRRGQVYRKLGRK